MEFLAGGGVPEPGSVVYWTRSRRVRRRAKTRRTGPYRRGRAGHAVPGRRRRPRAGQCDLWTRSASAPLGRERGQSDRVVVAAQDQPFPLSQRSLVECRGGTLRVEHRREPSWTRSKASSPRSIAVTASPALVCSSASWVSRRASRRKVSWASRSMRAARSRELSTKARRSGSVTRSGARAAAPRPRAGGSRVGSAPGRSRRKPASAPGHRPARGGFADAGRAHGASSRAPASRRASASCASSTVSREGSLPGRRNRSLTRMSISSWASASGMRRIDPEASGSRCRRR